MEWNSRSLLMLELKNFVYSYNQNMEHNIKGGAHASLRTASIVSNHLSPIPSC